MQSLSTDSFHHAASTNARRFSLSENHRNFSRFFCDRGSTTDSSAYEHYFAMISSRNRGRFVLDFFLQISFIIYGIQTLFGPSRPICLHSWDCASVLFSRRSHLIIGSCDLCGFLCVQDQYPVFCTTCRCSHIHTTALRLVVRRTARLMMRSQKIYQRLH